MQFNTTSFILCFAIFTSSAYSQEFVGINNATPIRSLDMKGENDQLLRIQSTTTYLNEAGLELVRGSDTTNALDWKIANHTSGLRFATSNTNFVGPSFTKMLLDDDGQLGIGATNPATRVHIAEGDYASNSHDGYMILGPKSGTNMVFDNNGFSARSDGSPSAMFIQNDGGTTVIGSSNSATHTIVDEGKLVVGGGIVNASLNIQTSDLFHLQMANEDSPANQWFVGASNENWAIGNNYLAFTPTLSSADAKFRLYDTDENDGNHAPVEIRSSADQTLLLDGNEIDGRDGPLYFNHNSDYDTYINLNGGKLGIGTTTPHGLVHINTTNFALNLQRGDVTWRFGPTTSAEILVTNNVTNWPVAMIDSDGSWVSLSDSTKKCNALPLDHAMEKINAIAVHSYNYKNSVGKRPDFGVIAQELKEVVPEAVFESEGQYGVTYDQLTALAIKGIQEQQQEIEELLEMAAALENTP